MTGALTRAEGIFLIPQVQLPGWWFALRHKKPVSFLRGQGCRSPRSAGLGTPFCPPLVCWGNPCQARCVPELSALNSVSAFLCNILPNIDILLQICFQCEILSCGHPPVPGRAALAPSLRELPRGRKLCTPHLQRQCGEPESGRGVCDPHGRSPVLAGAHLLRDGRHSLSEPAWGGQLGDEGLHSLCCWLS